MPAFQPSEAFDRERALRSISYLKQRKPSGWRTTAKRIAARLWDEDFPGYEDFIADSLRDLEYRKSPPNPGVIILRPGQKWVSVPPPTPPPKRPSPPRPTAPPKAAPLPERNWQPVIAWEPCSPYESPSYQPQSPREAAGLRWLVDFKLKVTQDPNITPTQPNNQPITPDSRWFIINSKETSSVVVQALKAEGFKRIDVGYFAVVEELEKTVQFLTCIGNNGATWMKVSYR